MDFPHILDELLGAQEIQVDGTAVKRRAKLNFVQTGGTTINVADDTTNERTDIEIGVASAVAEAIDDLRLREGADGDIAHMKGGGAAGVFVWSDTPATDDGGTILNALGLGSSTEGWRRVYSGPLNVQWFGALGNGSANDTTPIVRALAVLKARAGGALFFPYGTYLCDADTLNLVGPGGGDWANIKLMGETKRSATLGGSIIKARTAGTYLIRFAGQNMVAEDVVFHGGSDSEGDATAVDTVVFFDYQSFQSGLSRCFVLGARQEAPITVTPDHTTDSFTAVAHGLVDGDQVYFRSSASLPSELFQAVPGTYNWVWFIVNATDDTFQVERYEGEGAFAFGDNGSGTITVREYGGEDWGHLVRIGGTSGLQADTGFIRDCVLYQNPVDSTQLAGRGIFISDENAVLWDIQKTHIQGCVDSVYVRAGGCTLRECTIFPSIAVSRSHIVKDGVTQPCAFTDFTATEVDAVPWLVVLGSQATDADTPWRMVGNFISGGRAHINWDCRQPLILEGMLGGDVNITATGAHNVVCLGATLQLAGDDSTLGFFKGATERVVSLGGSGRAFSVDLSRKPKNWMRRLSAPHRSIADAAEHGFGIFIDGGDSNDTTIRKGGPIVLDCNIADTLSGYSNQAAATMFAYRAPDALDVDSVDTGADELTITTHGLTTNDSIRLVSTGSLPAPLAPYEQYWVLVSDADTIQLARAPNGTAIDLTSAGSGTITAFATKAFCLVTFDISNLNYADATRFDSIGPMYMSAPGGNLALHTAGVTVSTLFSEDALSVGTDVAPDNPGEAFLDYDGTPSTGAAMYLHSDANAYGLLFNVEKAADKYLRSSKGAGYCKFDATTGDFAWSTAPTGTAGNAVTLTERMRLKQDGTLQVNAGLEYNASKTGGTLTQTALVDTSSTVCATYAITTNIDVTLSATFQFRKNDGTTWKAQRGATFKRVSGTLTRIDGVVDVLGVDKPVAGVAGWAVDIDKNGNDAIEFKATAENNVTVTVDYQWSRTG